MANDVSEPRNSPPFANAHPMGLRHVSLTDSTEGDAAPWGVFWGSRHSFHHAGLRDSFVLSVVKHNSFQTLLGCQYLGSLVLADATVVRWSNNASAIRKFSS